MNSENLSLYKYQFKIILGRKSTNCLSPGLTQPSRTQNCFL